MLEEAPHIRRMLSASGLRPTFLRYALLRLLDRQQCPATFEELAGLLQMEKGTLTSSRLKQALRALIAAGVVQVTTSDDVVRYGLPQPLG
jgi:Fe2+ or Zn2+ uptake regulation protein